MMKGGDRELEGEGEGERAAGGKGERPLDRRKYIDKGGATAIAQVN